jgi:photosystem II protein PsbQ
MKWYRSLVGVVLVAIATLLVSCGSAPVKPPEVYTPDKIAEIQSYADRISTSEARLIELAKYIAAEDWTNVDNFIHGPLGELRQRMKLLAGKLLPADQPQALALADGVALDLNQLSEAATTRDYRAASRSFQALQSDLEALLDLVPEA